MPSIADAYAIFHQGDVQKAGELCKVLLARTSKNADAAYLLGLTHLKSGHLDEASTLFTQAIEWQNSIDFLFCYAKVFLDMGLTDQWESAVLNAIAATNQGVFHEINHGPAFASSRLFNPRGISLHSARHVDQNQPQDLTDPRLFTYDSRKTHKDQPLESVSTRLFIPNDRLAVIFICGQSQICNEGDPNGFFEPGEGVYNFNIFDGKAYKSRGVLLGTSCGRGNFTVLLGDLLVRRGIYDRVLLVPVGHGGTFMSEWQPGAEMYPRIVLAMRQLHDAGITVTHALWQQGEAEAGGREAADATAWRRMFDVLRLALRYNKMTAPIYVAQSTLCHGPANEKIRAAQRGVVNPALGIYPGPDTDAIGIEERCDGCHFSLKGMTKAAELWFAALTQNNS